MDLTYWVIILTILAVIFISYLYLFDDLSGSHYENYISTLILIGTMVAAVVFIYQYKQANDESRSDQIREYVRELRTNLIDFEKLFMEKYPYLSRLYQQIYQNNVTLQGLSPNLTGDQIRERSSYETHMCAIMFQIIENVYLENFREIDSFNNPINVAWINKWKSWFKSEIVREQWYYRKYFLSLDTQKFIEKNIL